MDQTPTRERLPIRQMKTLPDPTRRTWSQKFRDAVRGVAIGVAGQSSFRIHLLFAVLVTGAAIALRVSLLEWCLLLLCITAVLVAEMFNSALEWLAKAVSLEYDHQIGNALDIGSAGVLLAALGASVAGTLIFVYRLGTYLGWWPEVLMG